MESIILEKAKLIYDYLNIETEVCKSDLIIGLGCMDKSIPKRCAKLYQLGYGKVIIFSGNVGKGTEGILDITEAERFKEIALENGVPENKILLEKEATNTYENYKFTKNMLDANHISYQSVIIVQKPYVKRRCSAIADVELADKQVYITSDELSFEEFIEQSKENKTMNVEEIIHEIVGEISIIITAPKFHLQSEQIVPTSVINAYYFLLKNGYNKHVITDEKIEKVIAKWKQLGIITSQETQTKYFGR